MIEARASAEPNEMQDLIKKLKTSNYKTLVQADPDLRPEIDYFHLQE